MERDTHGRFAKGQSGNPNGRPPAGMSFAEVLRRALAESDRTTKVTRLEQVVEAAIVKAVNGDLAAIAFVVERLDGKMPDKVQQLGEVRVRVLYGDDGSDSPTAEAAPGSAAD